MEQSRQMVYVETPAGYEEGEEGCSWKRALRDATGKTQSVLASRRDDRRRC